MRLLHLLIPVLFTVQPALAQGWKDCELPRNVDRAAIDAARVIAACSAIFEDVAWALRPIGWAYVNRGTARLIGGDAQGALEDYEVALVFEPGLAVAQNNRAYALMALGRPAEALASAQAALKTDARNPNFIDTTGEMLCVNGRPEEALAMLREALALDVALVKPRQRVLKAAGTYRGPIDGDFGRGSQAALRAWVSP